MFSEAFCSFIVVTIITFCLFVYFAFVHPSLSYPAMSSTLSSFFECPAYRFRFYFYTNGINIVNIAIVTVALRQYT